MTKDLHSFTGMNVEESNSKSGIILAVALIIFIQKMKKIPKTPKN